MIVMMMMMVMMVVAAVAFLMAGASGKFLTTIGVE